MKSSAIRIVILCSSLFLFSSFKHPLKLTASLIEYDNKTGNLRMECKVFIDDFQTSINRRLTKDIDLYNLTKEDKIIIEDYFNRYYSIILNESKLSFKYKSSEIQEDYNVVTIKFAKTNMPIKKGDKFLIENILFFEDFGFSQSNRVTLRIPPFLKEYNYQTNVNEYSFSYTF